MEQTLMTVPRAIAPINMSLDIYRLTEQVEIQPGEELLVNVGYNDTGYVKGFHAPETTGSVTFRWTSREAYVRIPAAGNTSLRVELRLERWRPPPLEPAKVSIQVNGKEMEVAFIGNSAVCSFVIPAKIMRGTFQELKIASDTFVPRVYMNSTDSRELGVLVYWIRMTALREGASVEASNDKVKTGTVFSVTSSQGLSTVLGLSSVTATRQRQESAEKIFTY
jgi:hypothetical protein